MKATKSIHRRSLIPTRLNITPNRVKRIDSIRPAKSVKKGHFHIESPIQALLKPVVPKQED